MSQKSIEILLIIYCLILPFLLLIPKIGSLIKNYFRNSKTSLISGLIIFSVLPIIYDYYYNNLEYYVIIRISYVLILFYSLYEKKIYSIKYSHYLIYLILFLPLYFDVLPGGIITIQKDIIIKTNVIGTIPLCFYLYIILNPIQPTDENLYGLTIEFKIKHFFYTLLGAVILTLTVLPTSIFLDFTKLKDDIPPFSNYILSFFTIILAVGFPEEMFFRVIQFYILKKYHPKLSTINFIIISSLFFGIAHIFSPTPKHPIPNWNYAVLASMFAIMYSYIYIKTNQLFQAALIHTLVDSIWVHLFML